MTLLEVVLFVVLGAVFAAGALACSGCVAMSLYAQRKAEKGR